MEYPMYTPDYSGEREQNKELKAENKKLKAENKDLASHNKELTALRDHWMTEAFSLLKDRVADRADHDQLLDEYGKLVGRMMDANQREKKLLAEVDKWEGKARGLEARVKRDESYITDLRNALIGAKEKNSASHTVD